MNYITWKINLNLAWLSHTIISLCNQSDLWVSFLTRISADVYFTCWMSDVSRYSNSERLASSCLQQGRRSMTITYEGLKFSYYFYILISIRFFLFFKKYSSLLFFFIYTFFCVNFDYGCRLQLYFVLVITFFKFNK